MEGLSSSVVLSFKCTVCKKECESYADWISHLVENEHQNLARVECRKWDESVRECVIVAYADFPVIKLGRKIVQVFGCLSRGRFVTDFVTWEHRPKVAFIQFESRKKAWEVIPKIGKMSQLKIQNRRIQVKKAIDVMELEWNEFFPPQKPIISPKHFKDSSVQTETPSIANPCQKRKFDCIGIDVDDQGDSSNPAEGTTNHLPCPLNTLSQDFSSNNNFIKDEGTTTTSHIPFTPQIISHEESLISLQSPSLKDNTSSHSTEEKSKNLKPVQPQQVSTAPRKDHCTNAENGTDNHATLPPPLSNEDISNNNLKNSTNNQLPVLPILSQKDCSNNSVAKNGTINHLPAPASLILPCKKKNSSSSPAPKKEPSKKKIKCVDAISDSGKETKSSLPSLLGLPLKKQSGLRQNKTKRRRLIKADVQTIITTPKSFQTQYKEICDDIVFPVLEYNNVMSLVKSMEQCVQETYPKSKFYVFRNMYLKLKNPGSNKLLIFLDTQGIWEEDCVLENTTTSENILFMHPDLKKPVTDFWRKLKVKKLSDVESNDQDFIPELKSFGVEFQATDLSFTLVTRQHFILEVQTCRLLNYMTAFDPRTISIMAVVKYWGHVNGVTPLVPPENTNQEALSSVQNQAILLEWLIIVFLSSKRYIPTVRQILERPHNKLIMFKQDIGFHEDMTFAKAWAAKRGLPEVGSEDFTKSVFSLVQGFFIFCSQLLTTPFVMNSRDGEIIKAEQFSRKIPFCQSAGAAGVITKLSEEELTAVKKSNAQVGKPFVSMLHPLCLDHMIAFDKSTAYGKSMSVIKTTAEKLENVSFYGSSNDNSYVDLKLLLLS